MPRQFITVTEAEFNEKLAENLRSRELELLSYDFEKENHEKAILALGDISWTPELEQYKGLPRDAMIVRALANGLSDVDIKTISDLNAKDKHIAEIHAVGVEVAKSERHYDAILTALPAGKTRDDALAAVKVKEDAQKAKQLGITVAELPVDTSAIKQ